MTKVLVTGYGGFLGAAICRSLISAGFSVRGVARSRYPELEQMGVECWQGDVSNRDTVRQALKDCDAVVHTAAKAGVWGGWDDYYRINTLATSHLLEAAHEHQLGAFVFTSSPSVTFAGTPQSGVDETAPYPERWLCFYPHTKALAEQAVLRAADVGSVKTCALRPHLIWGRGDPHLFPRVIERAKTGRLRRVGAGTNLIDTVHVDNAATAHRLALEKLLSGSNEVNGQAMFLTDGQPVECWAWISRILQTAGVTIPNKSISFAAAYRLGGALEAVYWMLGRKTEPPMTRFVAAQLAMDHYFSIARARELIGYAPNMNIDQKFDDCRPWLRQLASQ